MNGNQTGIIMLITLGCVMLACITSAFYARYFSKKQLGVDRE